MSESPPVRVMRLVDLVEAADLTHAQTSCVKARPVERPQRVSRLGRRDTELAADATGKAAIDLAMARHGRASPRIAAARPDRVPPAFADLSAPVCFEVSLEVAEPHAESVTRTGSVVAPSGRGLGSPSST